MVESLPATTYSEAQRVEILSALAASDGMPKHAAKRLGEQGVDIAWTDIRALREQHATMYQALAAERSRTAEEALTIEFRETVRLGQRVTRNYLEDLLDRQESGELTREEERALPQIIQAMQKVVQVGTDKLLALTGRPTDGSGGNGMLESIELLTKLGVIDPVKRPAVDADTTAEEVS